MKRVKVAVLRARHDGSKPLIPDRACIEMILTNANRTSVLNYWENVTDGHLDFVDSSLFPWVDIDIGADDVSRETQCARAFDATKALPGAILDGFDVFVVLSWPGQLTLPNPLAGKAGQPATIVTDLDGGAGPVVQDKPACALPIMTNNHTFMCHEVGHTLGWHHSYGVLNNGIDWDGKAPFTQGELYGDPYDIMSSASFGARWLDPAVTHYSGDPEFAGPTVADWPNPAAFTMGPAPARAHLHLWDPTALRPGHVLHETVPVGGQTERFEWSARLPAARNWRRCIRSARTPTDVAVAISNIGSRAAGTLASTYRATIWRGRPWWFTRSPTPPRGSAAGIAVAFWCR
jgi:hypothetical protein